MVRVIIKRNEERIIVGPYFKWVKAYGCEPKKMPEVMGENILIRFEPCIKGVDAYCDECPFSEQGDPCDSHSFCY